MVTLLKATGVTRYFGSEIAIESANFEVEKGELVVLESTPLDPSESILLNLLSGHLDPDSGEIEYMGEEITTLTPLQRAEKGLVKGLEESALFEHLTIADHILAVSRNLAPGSNELYAQWQNDSDFLRKGIKRLADVSLHVSMSTLVNDLKPIQKKLLCLGLATLEHFDMLLWSLGSLNGVSKKDRENLQYILQDMIYDGKTILLSTSSAWRIHDLSNRTLVLKNGLVSKK